MNLKVLLQALKHCEIKGDTDVDITNICYHSRDVGSGSLFVAIPGFKADGRDYVLEAVKKGASAVVFEGSFFDNLRSRDTVPRDVVPTQVRVLGARLALAQLSAAYYVHPTKSMYLAGITGTNGKTTLTYLCEALWQASGMKTGVMGTINYRFPGHVESAGQTTPESLDLQRFFSRMREEEVSHVAMEVSSHAVQLGRVEDCQFNSCIFTNLSRDHLDFHGTMEEYYRAKEKLFTNYLLASTKRDKLAIIHADKVYGKRLFRKVKSLKIPVVTYGFKPDNDILPKKFQQDLKGFEAELKTPRGIVKIRSCFLGRFNLLNGMAAVMTGLHSGCEISAIQKGLTEMPPVPGRLERLEDSGGRHLFIDYAHTPDALKSVLTELRHLAPQRIITVFGCGGDRDRGKRPKMGFESARLSDICLVTSDNPRTEDPEAIIQAILPGVKKGGLKPFRKNRGYLIEPDRKKAIDKALEIAKKGDVVLVAGKGHEDYQIVGAKKYHFSDREIMREFLK